MILTKILKCLVTGPKPVADKRPKGSPAVRRDRGRPWMRKRQAVFERDGYLCLECRRQGRVTLAVEVDHIVPLHLGGTDALANLESICKSCHDVKSAAEEKERR